MMKSLLRISFLVVFFLTGYAFMLGLNEEKHIYFPEKEFADDPGRHGWEYEDVFLKTHDAVKLHGWYIQKAGAIQTLLYLHGNAGNISDCLDFMGFLREHLNVNVFLFDYRGYGKSDGSPSEQGVYQDALAAYHYVTEIKQVKPSELIVFGKSLGGAVAIDLVSRKKAGKLVLENTFTSALDMAKDMFPFLPIKLFIKTKFHSALKLSKIKTPKLIIHANKDKTVPFKLGQKLFDNAAEPKSFHPVDTDLHGSTYQAGGHAYAAKLKDFIQEN